jgi:hypothetical protein
MAMALAPEPAGDVDVADSKRFASRLLSPSRAFHPAWLLFATHQEDCVSQRRPAELWSVGDAGGFARQTPAALARPVAALHVPDSQSRLESQA